jgi:uncharacterized protein (TIGR00297 family)
MPVLAVAELTLAPLSNFDLGALCAAAVAIVAWRARTLTAGGAVAAFVVGTAAVGGLGLPGAAILLTFFVSSVALSRVGRARKRKIDTVAKAGARDGLQVLANGGVAAACALAALGGDPRFVAAFAGAFAAANADTWGTEIGTLVAAAPRSILTFRPVATGISGGVTAAGTAAELAGAAAVAAVATSVAAVPFWPVVAAGAAGALVDSLLGASAQALRWCAQCERYCETDPHACGANTVLVRGASWFGNDTVNFAATLAGAAAGFLLG